MFTDNIVRLACRYATAEQSCQRERLQTTNNTLVAAYDETETPIKHHA